MVEHPPDNDAVLAQFNRLMLEVLRGSIARNCFRPWEIEVLLDIETCGLRESIRRPTLKQYQKAAQRHLERGGGPPLKLSEFLEAKRTRTAS